ncbi:uncharacterized protein LOC129598031 [Paramacrobiotus metropolitanus]|uniref:uncharacterized protein LOC129598031 n=1 Tax=Paramacrobiotus metropolitanus TaxID=2943436 RepID=UPI002445C517|nr:uncharacterized protein LOC129598031 [Paramacrobiotus metropolitanus]
MEAFTNHLNKMKIPEIDTPLESTPSVASSVVSAGEFSIPQLLPPAEGNAAQPVEERVQIKQPNPHELMVERVITTQAPDLAATHSAEYEPDNSTEEEDEPVADEHGSHGQRRMSGAKKLKNKLSKAFNKVFHTHVGEEKKEEDLQQHHAPPETGNPDDASNKVTLHKEIPASSHDQNVQQRLESAFATEGLKASRDPSEPTTTLNRFEAPATAPCAPATSHPGGPGGVLDLGRMMDLQDHRAPHLENLQSSPCPPPRKDKNPEKSPEKVPYSVRRAELAAALDPVLADLSEVNLSPLRRDSRPHVPVYTSPEPVHFDSVTVRDHVGGEGHLIRSKEMWNLPDKTADEQQRRSPMQDMEKDGAKFSSQFVRVGEHGDAYQERLEMAREKWINPIAAAPGIPTDKSISSFQSEPEVLMRSFERVESDTDVLKEGHHLLTEKINSPMEKPRLQSNQDPLEEISHLARKFVAERDERPSRGSNGAASNQPQTAYSLDKEEFANRKPSDSPTAFKKPLREEDSGAAPEETGMRPVEEMTPQERADRIVDMETEGNDLAPRRRDYQVASTVPGDLEQPVLEDPNPPVPDIPRETDRPALDRADTLEESHTEGDEKSLVSNVLESVESVMHAVTGIFHRDTPEVPPADADHPQRTGIVDKVVDKMWDVFTAGTGGPDVPVLPDVEEKAPEVAKETAEVVEVLPVSGEFITGPVKVPEAGLSAGQQRRQTASRDI